MPPFDIRQVKPGHRVMSFAGNEYEVMEVGKMDLLVKQAGFQPKRKSADIFFEMY
jgi:hypothetical protein